MTTDPEPGITAAAGRQIQLTPMPPGAWLIIGGGVVAAFGPLFGFLIGSMMGSTTDTGDLSPIYLFLFLGLLVGGLGVAAVLLGVHRMLRHRRTPNMSRGADTPPAPGSGLGR
jgi:hypothetical protein